MNTLCHVEYEVTDLERAQTFYQGLFGWDFRPFMDGMVVFGQGETHIGGLQKVEKISPGISPSLWFQVASLEESLAKVKALGGTTPHEILVIPGNMQTVAVLDPDGNQVGLVQYD